MIVKFIKPGQTLKHKQIMSIELERLEATQSACVRRQKLCRSLVSPSEVLDQTYLAGEYYSVNPVAINNPKVDVLTENCRSAAWLNWGRSRTLPCSPAQPLPRSRAKGLLKEGSIREEVGKEPCKVCVFCSSLLWVYAKTKKIFGLNLQGGISK